MRHAKLKSSPAMGIYIIVFAVGMVLLGSHLAKQFFPQPLSKVTATKKPQQKTALQSPRQDKAIQAPMQPIMKTSSPIQKAENHWTRSTVKDTIQVTSEVGVVRESPGLTESMIMKVRKGSVFPVDQVARNLTETWYHIKLNDIEGWLPSADVRQYTPPKEGILLNAPVISQLPELQRGCEVTSLAMLLNNVGIKTTKMELAKEIKKDPTPFQHKDGKVYFGNPNDGFVGNIYDLNKPGLGVFHGPVFTLARQYLGKRAIDLTGKGFDAVIHQLNDHRPVWVIITSTYKRLPDDAWETWETPHGDVKVTYKEHSVLVTGYDQHYIYFNDPLTGEKNKKVKRSDFVNSWKQFGEQAISYN